MGVCALSIRCFLYRIRYTVYVRDDGKHALKIWQLMLQFHKKKLETAKSCIDSMNKSSQNNDKKTPYMI